LNAMTKPARQTSYALPSSPYMGELQHRGTGSSFTPAIEAEYIQTRLLGNRTLIRVTVLFAALLAALRGLEQSISGFWHPAHVVEVALVMAASMALIALAWSRAFERFYLPIAQVVVPFRNSVAAFGVVGAASHGQLELLTI